MAAKKTETEKTESYYLDRFGNKHEVEDVTPDPQPAPPAK